MIKKGHLKDFAVLYPKMYDKKSREEKGARIVKTLTDYFGKSKLKTLEVLDVGASTGIIDNVVAKHFKKVVGIDVDKQAVEFANKAFGKKNLRFQVGDAMKLKFKNGSFDVVICTHVYEHVPNSQKLFDEIYRVLRPGGVCYLASINSLWPIEPHYKLLFLSYLPRGLADLYVKLTGKSDKYYEKPATYWGIKNMTNKFKQIDYTSKIISDPKKYGYHKNNLSLIAPISKFISPTIFWILVK